MLQSKPLKPRKCRMCPFLFTPARPFVTWCSPDCGVALALEKVVKAKQAKAAKERKAERADTVRRKQAAKRLPDLIAEAQTAFNAYIRARDANQPCICCGRTETAVNGLGSHGWDCGHYRSTGSASHLRFNEDNAHRQLVYCNRYGSGRAVDYRIGLITRIGIERVEALEADNSVRKWSREELIGIKAKYAALARELKKATA